MQLKRGDLVMIHDPLRGTGSGSGMRGLAFVDSLLGETEVRVRPLNQTHLVSRVPLSAVHAVYSASHVAPDKEFLR